MENSPRPPLTVLVVDDNPVTVNVLSLLLRIGGHLPIKALGGNEGLELALSGKPDVIVLDVMMPGVDGFEVLSELRKDPRTIDIPVIFLTAKIGEQYRERAILMGACGYITKPFSRRKLLDAIDEAALRTGARRDDRIEGGSDEAARPGRGRPRSRKSTTRVIIVDDNPDDVRLIEEMLSEAGANSYSVSCHHSLSSGVTSLEEEEADILLLDLNLPDSQGLETLEKVQKGIRGIPIIVLAGIEDKAMAVEAVRRGAQDYLVKGQTEGGLLSRSILHAIERKRINDKFDRQLERLEEVVEERTADLQALNRDLMEAGELLRKEVAERTLGQEEVQRLTRKLMREDEEIKTMISRELHDQVAQSLSALKINLGSTRALVDNSETPRVVVAARLASIETELSDTLLRVRNLLSGLRPPLLEHFRLVKAIEHCVAAFSKESGVEVEFSFHGIPDSLSGECELQLFNILQEALQNVGSHSGAGRAWVRLEGNGTCLSLTLRDDGRGFAVEELNGATMSGHFGLLGMRERAAMLGAKLEVLSVPNEGTTITVEVPLGRT